MQKIGKLADTGFDLKDLKSAKKKFEKEGYECELIALHDYVNIDVPEAYVLIVRNGADAILENWGANRDDMMEEQLYCEWDKKAKMRGKVVNKHARYNLCYGEHSQEPDYVNGKGRIIDFKHVPCTNFIKNTLPDYFGEKANGLVAEGNLYYDTATTYIDMHGDFERKKVIAIRLGATFSLHFQWFINCNQIGTRVKLSLNHSDLYCMDEMATGNNWKKKIVPTLRHGAGDDKYLTIKPKK